MYIHYFLDDNPVLSPEQLPESMAVKPDRLGQAGYIQKLVEALEESGLEISLLFRCSSDSLGEGLSGTKKPR